MHFIERRQDHNAHVNDEERGFDDCYQVVVHCESKAETVSVAQLLTENFDLSEEDGDVPDEDGGESE